MKSIARVLIVALVAYLAACLLLYIRQDAMLFFPVANDPITVLEHEKNVYRVERDGVSLQGWLVEPEKVGPEQLLIIYYGGNAEDVSAHLPQLDRFGSVSFLAMNYRGYGGSEGSPDQDALYGDALYVFDRVLQEHEIDASHVALVGRSLGSGVATYVARHRAVAGVALITPFDSIAAVGQNQYPVFPVRLLIRHPFPSLEHAPHVDESALFLVASRDRIIPYEHSRNLMDYWNGTAHEIVIEGADHNSITGFAETWSSINAFLENCRKMSISRNR